MEKLIPLTLTESRDLTRLEGVVQAGLNNFVEVGNALAEIRDRKLYRNAAKTWEVYLAERWNFGRSYACRLIAAAEVAETEETLPMGNKIVVNERQARAVDAKAKTIQKTTGSTRGQALRGALQERRTEIAEAEKIKRDEAKAAKKKQLLDNPSKGTTDGINQAAALCSRALKVIRKIRLSVADPEPVEDHGEQWLVMIRAMVPINREGKKAA